ncbi:uncharacterized protein LOC130282253 [Hyla sarda]|uniref:uncharacterized protein LOC130282253 n=1 Tax=Hyla sarda TaxID=327740 RepID=UPI0024C34569|nr:uncharacterized protein LOC130282253 [Hyla sarda]
MSSNTFHYNAEDTQSIIARTNFSSEFLQIPAHDFRSREFERESKHLVNLELHCATLTEYLKVQWIPRGLRVRLRPTVFSEKKEFCELFEQILNKCSSDLMTLTVDFLQKEITLIQEKIATIETQLNSSLSPEDLSKLKEKVSTTLESHKKESERKKRDKFVRDTEDYLQNRVYRWQEFFPPPRGYHSRRGISQDTFSSSSEGNNFSQSRGRFLARRRPRRRGGEAAGTDTAVTRSQAR